MRELFFRRKAAKKLITRKSVSRYNISLANRFLQKEGGAGTNGKDSADSNEIKEAAS
jgi:hypothetical protein